jgi:hypothetical protein
MSPLRGWEAADDVTGIVEDPQLVLHFGCQEELHRQVVVCERLK